MLRYLPFILPLTAVAAEPTNVGISSGTYLQAALALTLIVALLGGTAWLARKVSAGKGFGRSELKIIGGIALGPRERIVLLEVGNEWLVVGIVPGQIRTLHRLEKGSMPIEKTPVADEKPFVQWLHGMSERHTHE